MSAAVRWVESHAVALLVVIVVLSASIRAYGFRGYSGLDDAEYARFAYYLANGISFPGDYTGPAVFPLRIGVIAPTALFYRIFGVTEWAMVLYPFAISLAGIVVAYWCASLFFGAGAGVLAAGLLGLFAWDIDSATRLLPDLPAAFFATVGITTIAWASRRWATRPGALLLAGAAAGVAFGVSWLTKETVAYLVPFCAVCLALTARREGLPALTIWAGVAAGAASILGAEALVYYGSTGDPLLRVHEMERNYRQWPNGFFTEGSDFGWAPGAEYRSALLDRLLISGPSRILLDASFYSVPAVALAGVAIAWLRGRREYLIPALWFASLVMMFNFASSSTRSYVPLALFHRYLYLIFFPAIVIVAGFLWDAVASSAARGGRATWLHRGAAVAAVAVICWHAAPALYFGVVKRSNTWNAEVLALDARVTAATPVYADALSLRAFEFLDRYPATTRWTEFDEVTSSDQIPAGSLVIVNRRYLEWLDRNAGMWVNWPAPGATDLSGYRQHSFYRNPPASWRLIWHNDNARVYKTEASAAGVMTTAKNPS